jgi:hypothetical protein
MNGEDDDATQFGLREVACNKHGCQIKVILLTRCLLWKRYNRQRPKLSLLDKTPWTQNDTWIAPNAVVAGDVELYDQA